MPILKRLLGFSAQQNLPPDHDFWYTSLAGQLWSSQTGISMSPELALRVSAVFGCVKVLAETLAQVPLIIYRRTRVAGQPSRDRAQDHPLWDVLHLQPNNDQTSFLWRELAQSHLALRGNFFSMIVPGRRGAVDQLLPIHPDRVEKVERMENGRRRYVIREDNSRRRIFTQDEIFHVPGLGFDGLRGTSVVSYARDSMGLALAAESHGARTFKNALTIGGTLEHPGKLGDKGRENLRQWLQENHGGFVNAARPMILEEGMKWNKVSMTHEDAQFIETRKHQVEEIARWFRIPLHKIQSMDRATFSNIEQQSIEFVQDTMMPWFVRWEQALNTQLILARQTFFVEFLVTGLLRGDAGARAGFYNTMISNGIMTINEVRRMENLPPKEGGDVLRTPLNMRDAAGDSAARLLPEPSFSGREDIERIHRLWLGDKARSLARAEEREILRAVGKPNAEFRTWLDDYFVRHQGHVERALEDVITSCTARGLVSRTPRTVAAEFADVGHRRLRAAEDPKAMLDGWAKDRGRELVDLAMS